MSKYFGILVALLILGTTFEVLMFFIAFYQQISVLY